MGLFTFMKDAGAKLFGMETSEEANAKKVEQIKEFVNKFELPVKNFGVTVDEEKACLTGEADCNPTREKIILAVGNINGIATVEDQMSVTEVKEPEAKFYTVQSGDNLSKIAKTYYGNPNKYPVIFEANKPMLTHPDKIYPGQTLRIPNLEGPTTIA